MVHRLAATMAVCGGYGGVVDEKLAARDSL